MSLRMVIYLTCGLVATIMIVYVTLSRPLRQMPSYVIGRDTEGPYVYTESENMYATRWLCTGAIPDAHGKSLFIDGPIRPGIRLTLPSQKKYRHARISGFEKRGFPARCLFMQSQEPGMTVLRDHDFGEALPGEISHGVRVGTFRDPQGLAAPMMMPTGILWRGMVADAALWAILLCGICEGSRAAFRSVRGRRRAARGLCPVCGYSLGTMRERCPECGSGSRRDGIGG